MDFLERFLLWANILKIAKIVGVLLFILGVFRLLWWKLGLRLNRWQNKRSISKMETKAEVLDCKLAFAFRECDETDRIFEEVMNEPARKHLKILDQKGENVR